MAIGNGLDEGHLTSQEIYEIIKQGLETLPLDGKRVLILIPDATRTMPLPLVFAMLEELLANRARQMDYLVALGTHKPLTDDQLSKLVGRPVCDGQTGRIRINNHAWDRPEIFTHIGTIPAEEIQRITDGMLSQDVAVQLNRLIFDYDQVIICGPVFPHEVAGFSGGNKYLFPGIAGPEIINFTHWLGALITSSQTIGIMDTPVRSVIERAAEFIEVPTACFSFVVDHEGAAGLFFGSAKEAWTKAAQRSAKRHVIYKDKAFKRVLSVMPKMYDDLWTAAKGMYKLEPVVADGGEVIIYAPHLSEVSYTHGKLLDELGYHCRDYFLGQWDQFKSYPGGVLAHSTHLKGVGTYDRQTGVEEARINVTLATAIPAERCKRLNLGYFDPAEIRIQEWLNREEDGILVVQNAGETLYRLK